MDIDKKLAELRRKDGSVNIFGKPVELHHLEALAIDEKSCAEIAKYFDIETGGECSPTRYVQQVLLEIRHNQKVEYAERHLERIKSEY